MYVSLTVATFGAPEVIAAGVVLGKSIHEAHRITFVSDPAGQIILRDLLTQPPAARFAAVQLQLRQRLLGEAQNEAAPLAPCVERYGMHLHRWAQRAEFPMPPETDDGLQLVTLLARDVDEGRLDRADVLLWLTTPSAYNPIP